ncbi:flavin-containing monooxygenase [Nocardia bovistercoris]|uniref:NAD(P)/FAD-dependent oxidoreductase n=1 Tax=Nocardia bovistercoris TaxID=2785916 RepID=A0A931IEI9_9NOCA|nr:NAD(P)/FAD-dependent oxidoreductase [Nocardia bovistercoris]MBH0779756.1 NAD(P)/FAD-dependent oxidoreductase [Nocardia bovistercoris]
MSDIQRCDAVVIGAGFAGMYALHRLRDDLGLRVRVFERGTDVGGTWYWNRYPGARCDVESMYYSYSFSAELEQEWEWSELYPAQPEILAYANHVADRFDLRADIAFETSVESAEFDEGALEWIVRTDRGETVAARFLITAVGCLSASRIPPFPGLDSFAGEIYHTGEWPHEGVDFSGKRVAVVGTGSSGLQVIPKIAEQAEHLTVFQRTPAFSLPARNRPLGAQEVAEFKADYPARRAAARMAPSGVPGIPPVGSALSVTDEQREQLLTERWNRGGTSFMRVFNDTVVNLDANEFSAEFVRERIRDIVDDPATADKLIPRGYPIGAKRICLDTDYWVTFNRDNVDLVSVRDTPIEEITAAGLRVGDTEYAVDVIVFATGYDAMTGPLNAIDIRGADGVALRETWAAGPRTYLGIATAGFPNLFMLTAPGSPSVLVNVIISIEQHVDWVADTLTHMRENGYSRIEAVLDAQDRWVEHVNEAASRTLFLQGNSWYLGANVPGKPRVFMPYVGGAGPYRKICDEVAADGYRGFTLSAANPESATSGRAVDVPAGN